MSETYEELMTAHGKAHDEYMVLALADPATPDAIAALERYRAAAHASETAFWAASATR